MGSLRDQALAQLDQSVKDFPESLPQLLIFNRMGPLRGQGTALAQVSSLAQEVTWPSAKFQGMGSDEFIY